MPEVQPASPQRIRAFFWRHRHEFTLLVIASVVFLLGIVSPPSLMDDIDGAHAQLARNMVRSGDWVIPHLDGVAYLEKPPLPYWLIAFTYRIFGVRDWAARIPFALAAILLCWITGRYGRWAFDVEPGPDPRWNRVTQRRAGFYAGVILSTCAGLFLFTRTLLPDVMVALCVCVAFWSFQRALNEDEDEAHPRLWAVLLAVALGAGMMLKGLIAVVIPAGGALVYLVVTRRIWDRETWRRLHLATGAGIFLLIAAPWHILATLRMPPYFDLTMHSGPGQYHGFFWTYFINEHLLRFLGLRYPHDYNTVPRLTFWLLNLLWLFPWSVYLPLAFKLNYRATNRAGRTRLLAVCSIGFLLAFFSFSTTQEYYSMPIYPAFALLLGSAIDGDGSGINNAGWFKVCARTAGIIAGVGALATAGVLFAVRGVPTPGDISHALKTQSLENYTLSLGHAGDLTLAAFAYLRVPLVLAGLACVIGAVGTWLWSSRRAVPALAIMMVMFFQAARLALVTFDPYLSSRPLADTLRHSPPGRLIVDGPYYPFSSVFFYADETALLLDGRINNLEYGSYAPGAPSVFIGDYQFSRLWSTAERCYLLSDGTRNQETLARIAGVTQLHVVGEIGGKYLFTNQPFSGPELALPAAGDRPTGREIRR